MKITLDASIKEHREIAELFRGCECEFNRSISGDLMGGAFVSTMNSPHYPKFVVYRLGDVTTKESITIDLDQAMMDLRMAIGTGIEFEQNLKGGYIAYLGKILEYTLIYRHQLISELGEVYFEDGDVKLSKDYLEQIGVVIEDGEE